MGDHYNTLVTAARSARRLIEALWTVCGGVGAFILIGLFTGHTIVSDMTAGEVGLALLIISAWIAWIRGPNTTPKGDE